MMSRQKSWFSADDQISGWFDDFAGGGPAEGAGVPPLEGGEGADLLLQHHQSLQPQDLRQSSAEIQLVSATP